MTNDMRYPEGHKTAVRERIVAATARALRQHGLAGVSIPALMREAGLTHGGFYSHFRDRDELVAEAVRAAASHTAEGVFGETLSLEETLARYLSTGHVDHPEEGCVLAALGADAPRQSLPVRAAFAEIARGFLRLAEQKVHPDGPSTKPTDEALAHAATMIGAVVLARLVDDKRLSARILAAAAGAIAGSRAKT